MKVLPKASSPDERINWVQDTRGIRRSLLGGRELCREGRRGGGAALAGTVQVLNGDNGGLNARSLVGVSVAGGEGDSNSGARSSGMSTLVAAQYGQDILVDSLAGLDVSSELLDVHILRGRARARDKDGLAIRAVDRAVAVAVAVGVHAGVEAEWGRERRNLARRGCATDGIARRSGRRSRCSGRRRRRRWRRGCGRGRVCGGGRPGHDNSVRVLAGVDRGLLCGERRGDDGATLARTIQVLESNCRRVQTRRLRRLRVVRGEGQLHRGVVDHEASIDILVQLLQMVRQRIFFASALIDCLQR